MNEKVKTILTEFRRGLEAIYGERLVKVVLFGSQARGDAAPDSDIDVLVVLRGPVEVGDEIHRTSNLSCEINLRTGALVSCVFMDEQFFDERNGPLLRNVRREGVAV